MNPAAKPLYETLKLNTRLFLNCFDGVDDEMAIRRPSDRVNNMAFIGVHTIDARMFIGNLTGCSVTHPFEALSGIRKIDDMTDFPKVADLRKAWTEVAGELVEHVALVSDEVLENKFRGCFRYGGFSEERARRVADRLWRLETMDDLSGLLD